MLFTHGMQAQQHRWKKCVDYKKDYAEHHLVTINGISLSVYEDPRLFYIIYICFRHLKYLPNKIK